MARGKRDGGAAAGRAERRGVQFALQALGTREAARGLSDLLGSAALPLKAESLPLR